MILLTFSALFLFIHQGQCSMRATVTLYADNTNKVYGSLTFIQEKANATVRITGSISGLNASSAHGFHVHDSSVSDVRPNCTAAGGHFNPYNTAHGSPTANINNRHVGDLGNITTTANGIAEVDIEDGIIQLYNVTSSILNRTIIVHRMHDDGGQAGTTDSTTTGSAGPRVLCGRIVSNGFSVQPTTFILYVSMIIAFSYYIMLT